jgi:hypothetical protein
MKFIIAVKSGIAIKSNDIYPRGTYDQIKNTIGARFRDVAFWSSNACR